eukprot:GDKI01026010.1.p1 GENE.GDKI01026010.1~~GDKI01026010.1.p1  ORF type:complete len:377 (-),score=77.42 GDKI01026010.1:21-1151(-)
MKPKNTINKTRKMLQKALVSHIPNWLYVFAAANVYCFASYVALRIPPRTKKRLLNLPERVHASHRGGAAERPENTLLAFDHAVRDTKTDLLELDVWLTKDKRLVVAHDNHLGRVCGSDKLITDTNFKDLPRVLDSNRLVPAKEFNEIIPGPNGAPYAWPVVFGNEPIPTLRELFEKYPKLAMSIDVKQKGSRESVQATVDLVREFSREDKTLLGSFSDTNTRMVREMAPEIATVAPPFEIAKLLALYYTGLLPFFDVKCASLQIPLSEKWIALQAYKIGQKVLKRTKSKFFSDMAAVWTSKLLWKFVTQEKLIKHLQKRGVTIFYWVCNDEKSIEKAFKLGADGVMTDKPTLLREWMDAHREEIRVWRNKENGWGF